MALTAAVVAFLVYYPTLGFSWTDTDDINLIVEDGHFLTQTGNVTQAFRRPFFPGGGEQKSYYRPLVTLSFLADAGTAMPPPPAPFHRTNAVLHAVATVLLFALARCFTKQQLLAAAAALGFALHPAAVQGVAWVPGRSDGLMAVFALSSLWAYVQFDRSGSRRLLGAHLALFAAALFSKESALALLPIAAAYSAWVTGSSNRLKTPGLLVGWLAVPIVWLLARTAALGQATSGAHITNILHNMPMLWIGLGKLVWPADLQVLATLTDSAWWPGVIALLLLGLAVLFTPRETRRLFLWATLGIPLLTLAPALLVNNDLALDNRLYLPLAGLALGAMVLGNRLLQTDRARHSFLLVTAAVGVLLSRSTLSYARAFASPRAFCEAAVAGSPRLPLAHVNLGSAEFRAGNLDAAEAQFQQAIKLDARWPVAHNNLGLVLMNRGRWQQAEQEFLAELAVNPNYPKAHYNLGLVLANTGREQVALPHFERVVALVPTDIGAWGELLKYWGPRDATRAAQIINTMQSLGVTFHSPSAASKSE